MRIADAEQVIREKGEQRREVELKENIRTQDTDKGASPASRTIPGLPKIKKLNTP